jgi:hypothetical protein
LANPELKKKEGHRWRFYEAIATFLIQQGEMYYWEGQFGSRNNDVDIHHPEYDSDKDDLEDDEMDDLLLRDIGVDQTVQDSKQDDLRKRNGPLCQPIHHSSLDFGAQLKRHDKICQVCEYEERGEVQLSVNICLAHSSRLFTRTHPPVVEVSLVRVDNVETVADSSWACPNVHWYFWNKFHKFYLKKGLWSSHAGLVNEEKKCSEFCRRHTSSELKWMKNEAMGIEDHRGKKHPLLDD